MARLRSVMIDIVVMMLVPCCIYGDVVTLKSGKRLTGVVTGQTATKIIIECERAPSMPSTFRTLDLSDVVRIEKGPCDLPTPKTNTEEGRSMSGIQRLRAMQGALMKANADLLDQALALEMTDGTRVGDCMRECPVRAKTEKVDKRTLAQIIGDKEIYLVEKGYRTIEPLLRLIEGRRVMSNRDIGGGKAEAIVQLSVSELLASIREMMREVLREGKFHGMEIDRVSLRTDKVALWGVGEVAGNPPSKDQ